MTRISYATKVTSSKWGCADLVSVLEEIGSQKHAELVTGIRQGRREKIDLPAFCIAELTGGRRIGDNVIGASCIVLDIDGIESDPGSTTSAEHVKDDLLAAMEDGSGQVDRAYAAFISPSGNGLKIVYRLNQSVASKNDFSFIYRRLSSELSDKYGELLNGGRVDTSASDITRATYMSHDPSIYIDESVWPLDVDAILMSRPRDKHYPTISSDFLTPGNEKSKHLMERVLFAANSLEAPHYDNFRNLCNAACAFGDRDFLAEFAQTIKRNSLTESMEKTKRSVFGNWERYLDSFFTVFGTDKQISVDYILGVAKSQGIVVELDPKFAHSSESYFDTREADQKITADFDKRYKVITHGKDTEILDFDHESPEMGFNTKSFNAVARETRMIKVYRPTPDGKTKARACFDIWFDNTRQYRGIDFVPGEEGTVKGNKLNLWNGFEIANKQKSGVPTEKNELKLWNHYINNLFDGSDGKNEQRVKYMLDWIANIIQNPGKKPGVSIALSGGQGTGKTYLGRVIENLVAPYHNRISNFADLESDFNEWAEGVIFVFVDESVPPTDVKISSRLKSYITDSTIRINKKNVSRYKTGNYINFLFASNDLRVVSMDADDRRYQVFSVGNTFKTDIDFFAALENELYENGGLAVLFNQLKNRDISGVNFIRDRVISEVQIEHKANSLKGVSAWIHDIYTGDGEILYPDPKARTREKHFDLESYTMDASSDNRVDVQILFSAYNYTARKSINRRVRDISLSNSFSSELKKAFEEVGFGKIEKTRPRKDGRRITAIRLPSLRDGLAALAAKNFVTTEQLAELTDEEEQQVEEKTPQDLTPAQKGLTFNKGGKVVELFSDKDRWEAEAFLNDGSEVPY